MAIRLSKLYNASNQYYRTVLAKSVMEAKAKKMETAFLCHSHKDDDLAKGLQVLLKENGWNIYIDWQDSAMPIRPNRETAKRIQQKISDSDWFLFLATPNSMSSKWCPWEIGYADSKKSVTKIAIIPTVENSGNWYGNEYLQLYSQITETKKGFLAQFPAGQDTGGILISRL